MLNENKKSEIREIITEAYSKRYPEWKEFEVTDILENKFFGVMISVKSRDYPDGELCLYNRKAKELFIFDSTPQLLNHIDRTASKILTAKEVLSFVIVVWILGIFTGLVFYFRDDGAIALVTTAMAGILGTYAGIKITSPEKES